MVPHGGELKELLVPADEASKLVEASRDWVSLDLTDRQMRDLELLLNGAFSPLEGFMGQADYERVRDEMRLSDGTLWPIPITLDIPAELATHSNSKCVAEIGPAEGSSQSRKREQQLNPPGGVPGRAGDLVSGGMWVGAVGWRNTGPYPLFQRMKASRQVEMRWGSEESGPISWYPGHRDRAL